MGLLTGAVGLLLDTGGDNTFHAVEAPPDTFFIHDFNLDNLTNVILSHCNQGCGLMGAAGALVDVHRSGFDSYVNEQRRPWSTHHDGGVAGPGVDTRPDPGGYTDLSQLSLSAFIDQHLRQGSSSPPTTAARIRTALRESDSIRQS